MKLKKIAASVLLATAMSPFAAADESSPVATVNGVDISQRAVESFIQHRRMQPNEQSRQMVLQELIDIELLAQDATKLDLQDSAEVKETLAALTKQVLAQARLRNLSENAAVSAETLQKAYDEKYGTSGKKEFNARHILLKEEDEAKGVIKSLDEGADFAELAKEKSTGPSGPSGGELGWFEPGQMVKPFSDAVALLKKGEYTKAPVQTKFGWHVIKLDDNRSVEPPAMDSVRAELERDAHNSTVESLLKSLRETAKIEMM